MPLSTVRLMPGVNAEVTSVLGQAQIVSSQLIRFKMAGDNVLAEKLGGWTRFYPIALGSPIRDIHAWEGINADTHLSAACTLSLNVISEGVGQDVTPRTQTTNPAVSFSTTMGQTTVTIDDAGITVSEFSSIYLLTPVAVGGIVLKGPYQIVAALDADSYTIEAATAALSSDTTDGLVPEFETTLDSPFVNVVLTNHGYVVGQLFAVPTSTAVGGLTISGSYIVQEVVDADNFTIIATELASSTAAAFMNGGDASIIYFIGVGPSSTTAGYGTGGYGDGGYGVGVVPTPSPGTPITATNWTQDNWGQILLSCPASGPIYQWSPNSGFSVATKIVNAPLINGGIFISQPAQILVAWASSIDGVQDPLLLQWSDSGDFENWTASSLTQAGSYRLPTGSRIVGGIAGPNFGVIWTDIDVWAMDYIEPPLVFGFNALASNCGVVSSHGMAVLNTTIYWMGERQFFAMTGERVQSLPCTVWDFVYQDLDRANLHKIAAAPNNGFNEVAWYFPSASGGTGEIDSYVKYNALLDKWDFGRLQRTAWIDQSVVGAPVGGDASGYLQQHETSPDADGQPLTAWFQTGFFELAEGESLTFVDWIIPDFKYGYYGGTQGTNLAVTFGVTDYPNVSVKTFGPYNVTSTVPYINTRFRGRLCSMRVESSDLGSFWRMGGLKFRGAPDGKR